MDVAVKEHDQVEITLKNISKNQLNLSEDASISATAFQAPLHILEYLDYLSFP